MFWLLKRTISIFCPLKKMFQMMAKKIIMIKHSKNLLIWTFDQSVPSYTTLTNFSTKYPMMCKVYTDVGHGII